MGWGSICETLRTVQGFQERCPSRAEQLHPATQRHSEESLSARSVPSVIFTSVTCCGTPVTCLRCVAFRMGGKKSPNINPAFYYRS